MSAPPRSPEELFHTYWEAEEARDLDAILACWAPDGTFVDRRGQTVEGSAALRAFYAASAAAFPRVAVGERQVVAGTLFAAARYVATLSPADGPDRHVRVAVVAQIADGRFTRLESYFDGAALAG